MTDFTSSSVPDRVRARYAECVLRRGPDECWPWLLSHGNHGYGQIGWGGKEGRATVLAHRLAYAINIGPIPDGLTVDHECRNRSCQNPAHLRLMTNVDNARLNGNAMKTHCPKGHPYDKTNTYRSPSGDRRCRECGIVNGRAWRATTPRPSRAKARF